MKRTSPLFILLACFFISVTLNASTPANANPCAGPELGQAAARCCLLDQELRVLNHDMNSPTANRSTSLDQHQRSYDRLEARLVLLRGFQNLAQDFNAFQRRLTNPAGSISASHQALAQVAEDANLLIRINSVHQALDALGASEALRTAENPEQLREALNELCKGQDDRQSAGRRLCFNLGFRGILPTGRFHERNEFLGAMLEAYTIAHGSGSTDQQRHEAIQRYRSMLTQGSTPQLIERLIDVQETSPLNDLLIDIRTEVDADDRRRENMRPVIGCLTEARYRVNNDQGRCAEAQAQVTQQLNDHREQMRAAVQADHFLSAVVNQSIVNNPTLEGAQGQARDAVNTYQAGLSAEQANLSAAIEQFQNSVTQRVDRGLQNLNDTELRAAILAGSLNDTQKERNYVAMLNYARDILNNEVGCSGDKNFIRGEGVRIQVDMQALHSCLTHKDGSLGLDSIVAELEDQKQALSESMKSITNSEQYREMEALRNWLAMEIYMGCSSNQHRVRRVHCNGSEEFGGRRLAVYELIDSANQVISHFENEATGLSALPTQMTLRRHNFCLRNRERFPNSCASATADYRAYERDQRAGEAYRDFYRTHTSHYDRVTGQHVVRERQSVGQMVLQGTAFSAVRQLPWALEYWGTNQALPYQRQMALDNKTYLFHQQQQWNYFQFHHFNPSAFGGYGMGFGQMPYMSPRPLMTPVQNISF
jgi:hypothetical protein